jgi:hypothetical protein
MGIYGKYVVKYCKIWGIYGKYVGKYGKIWGIYGEYVGKYDQIWGIWEIFEKFWWMVAKSCTS